MSDSFPFKWINKKWREGFYVTSMATAGSRWGVVMSRNAGFSDQVYNVWCPSDSLSNKVWTASLQQSSFSDASVFRLWSWTSCILVKASTDGGTVDTASRQQPPLGIRQLLCWVCQEGNLLTKLRKHSAHQLSRAHMWRSVIETDLPSSNGLLLCYRHNLSTEIVEFLKNCHETDG